MRFLAIPCSVLKKRGLSSTAKLLYGVLRYHQYDNNRCWPARDTLAREICCSVSSISRATGQLAYASLITVERSPRCSNLYSVKLVRDNEYLQVPSNLLRILGRKPTEKLLYAYLLFRQGENGVCWPHQRTIAADLGCSLPTIQKVLHDFEQEHILQVKHAHGGLKQGNQYRVTNKLLLIANVSPRSESRTKKCVTKDKISKELKRTGFANQNSPDCLSEADAQDEDRRLLI